MERKGLNLEKDSFVGSLHLLGIGSNFIDWGLLFIYDFYL